MAEEDVVVELEQEIAELRSQLLELEERRRKILVRARVRRHRAITPHD